MSPHKTKTGADLYAAMFATERAWEREIMARGLVRYTQAATGINCSDLRALYVAKNDAAKAYFDYLAAMRDAA